MCGIVGYIGEENSAPFLLHGLEKLEYRGYDSAGIAVNSGKNIDIVKSLGRLENLSKKLNGGELLKGNLGIGHTRWATHGEPSEKNAHPQVSQNGKFAVVHNGIIENYMDLKNNLISKDVKFISQTDTEVVAQYLEYNYKGNFFEAVLDLMKSLKGSYAFGIICEDNPGELIAARQDNPLIIGIGNNENFIASDVTAILEKTRDVIRLEDGEVAVLKKNSVSVFNKLGEEVKKNIEHIEWDITSAEKMGYDHFMMKEIMEQPSAVKNTVLSKVRNGRVNLDSTELSVEYLKSLRKINIVACGSAYHVGYVAKYIFEKMLRIPTEVEIASEFRYKSPIIDSGVLTIAISQSGETADTLAAIREAKKQGSKVLSIVNVVGSTIASVSDNVIYTMAGPEIAVATTKAYSTQLAVIYLLSIYMADKLGKITDLEYSKLVDELMLLPNKIQKILDKKEEIKDIAKLFYSAKNIFFIGRNVDYAVSLEGSLKLKEISYIHSEAYAAGELKHGPISLIEDGTPVVAIVTNDLFDKTASNINAVKSRGACVLSIACEKYRKTKEISDYSFFLSDICDMMSASLSVIPLQLFAYYVAALKGCDIDKPRNLAKSVTVE